MQSQMWMERETEESWNDLQKQLVKNQSFEIFCYKKDKILPQNKFILFLQKENEKRKRKKK